MTIVKSGEIDSESFIIIHNENAYNVKVENKEIISCDCEHHTVRNQICKHMLKVSMDKKLGIRDLNLKQIK